MTLTAAGFPADQELSQAQNKPPPKGLCCAENEITRANTVAGNPPTQGPNLLIMRFEKKTLKFLHRELGYLNWGSWVVSLRAMPTSIPLGPSQAGLHVSPAGDSTKSPAICPVLAMGGCLNCFPGLLHPAGSLHHSLPRAGSPPGLVQCSSGSLLLQ